MNRYERVRAALRVTHGEQASELSIREDDRHRNGNVFHVRQAAASGRLAPVEFRAFVYDGTGDVELFQICTDGPKCFRIIEAHEYEPPLHGDVVFQPERKIC